ncbi:MAG: ferredoxin--NADP reductase [Pseudomonadota bacterium]
MTADALSSSMASQDPKVDPSATTTIAAQASNDAAVSPVSAETAAYEPSPNGPTVETVLQITRWSDRLFSFRTTRPRSFRFTSGEFVMLGLVVNGKPLLRAYSVASPSWDEELEFYSVIVPDGPLTSRLQHIEVGDRILLGRKPVGTLVMDALSPAKRLYLFSTGTGVAPFASVIRDPETYERFDEIILTHTTWTHHGLAYSEALIDAVKNDPLVGEMVGDKLRYYPTTTRDPDYPHNKGRITTLIESGELFTDLGVPKLNAAHDRVMICGSMAMLKDTKALCEAAGLQEGANSAPGDFVVEKAFVG